MNQRSMRNIIKNSVSSKDSESESEPFNVDELLSALDNPKTDYLENKTFKTINEEVFQVIQSMHFSEQKSRELCEKLIGYRFVDEIYQLHKHKTIKTLPIKYNGKPGVLHTYARLANIKFIDKGAYVLCLNFPNKYSQYHFDDYLTFQKLSEEEELILHAYEHLSLK